MSRNETATCKELIEPVLAQVGWTWDKQLRIGPGRVNLTGDSMYDETQAIIADYQLRYRSIPLAILEAKAEGESAEDGMQQGSRYAQRLSIRFSIASNGKEWILTDYETGHSFFHDKTGEFVAVYLGKNREYVGETRVGNPHFLAVEYVVLAIFRKLSVGFARVCIAAGSRFC